MPKKPQCFEAFLYILMIGKKQTAKLSIGVVTAQLSAKDRDS